MMPNYAEAIPAKIRRIMSAGTISHWKFQIGAPDEARLPAFDDSNWQSIVLNYTWSSQDGEAWFRCEFNPPPVVDGLPLAGAQVELEMVLPTGATIYLEGEALYSEPSWVDTRVVSLKLTDNYQPGKPLHLVVRCKSGDSFGLFLEAGLRYSRLADACFELDILKSQLDFTQFLCLARPDLLAAWNAATAALDLAALAENRWEDWQASTAAARAALAPFADLAKQYTARLVAHSHIDMNWLWPMAETVDICRRDFSSADRLLNKYPEFHFSQSQAAVYRFMEQEYPDIFARMRSQIAGGRWEVTASTWVEGDLNMSAGEALVRQIVQSRRYLADAFGVAPRICWEPDTFGHPASLPQILKKSGIENYYFCRAGKRYPLFWWEGLDGSRLLGTQDLLGYGGPLTANLVATSVTNYARQSGVKNGMLVYGMGDHGGGATARDIENARRIDATPFLPRALPSTAANFFEQSRASQPDLPVVYGELNTIFEGCYTSHGDIKRMNRSGENALLSAESAATLASLQTGLAFPQTAFSEAWKTLCFHQFHDILCGCAIGITYREASERHAEVQAAARNALDGALQSLADKLDTRAGQGLDAARLVVFNPLAWTRDDLVTISANAFGGRIPAAVVDANGQVLPVQVAGESLLFIARQVPALGLQVYTPLDSLPADSPAAVWANPAANTLENASVRLRVHPASGSIDQLIDQASGRDIAGPSAGWGPEAKVNSGMINRLQIIWEQPHPMSAWNIGDITRVDHLITGAEVKVIEQGPVRATVEVRRKILHSSMVQYIHLYAGLDRIDFETEIDWHERGGAHHDAPMLRATFSPFYEYTRPTFEIAFAGLERPADGREVPALRWADLTELDSTGQPTQGLSLLNDCKYGHQAHGNSLGLTLVRASYEPDNNPDEGLHRFTYSLYPHAGDWRESGTLPAAAGLNQPLLALVTGAHAGPLQPGQAAVALSTTQVVLSAMKMAEDQPASGQAVVVRLFESFGRECDLTFKTTWGGQSPSQAWETDLLEKPQHSLALRGGELALHFTPYEIKTILFA